MPAFERTFRGGKQSLVLALLALLAGCEQRPTRSVDLLAPAALVELRTDVLDLPFLLAQPTLERGGWREPRAVSGVLWSRDPNVWLELPFATIYEKELRLTARSHPALGPRVEVAVSLNGTRLADITLTSRDGSFSLNLPEPVQIEGRNVVELMVADWKEKVADPKKRRRSYLALKQLEVRPLRPGWSAQLPGREPLGLRLPASSSASFWLREHTPFEIDVEAETRIGSGRLDLTLDRGAARETLAGVDLRPGGRRRASAAGHPPQDGFFRLEVANRGPAEAVLRSLVLRSRPGRQPRPPVAVRDAFLGRPRPNIVIFLSDTLRADHLGLYGHRCGTSPRLDDFAREAITFDEAWSVSSWTAPAVASLFTGLGPEAHGVHGLDIRLVDSVQTLAERLRASGYRTAAFVGNELIDPSRGFEQGFETWNGPRPMALYGARPRIVVEHALRWLDSAAEPFFLYVHTLDPHGPYEPAPEHRKLFATHDHVGGQVPAHMRKERAAYEGEIHEADAAFGAFLDSLRTRGLLDRSLLAFTADHGEEFGDHGGRGHGHSLYPELVRVPLILRLPGGALAAQRVAAPVQHPDLFVTLLEATGAARPEGTEGRPLWEVWVSPGETEPEQRVLFGRTRLGGPDGWDKAYVRDRHLKLIVNYEARSGARSRIQLFDLQVDPENRTNQAALRALAARHLRDRMIAIERAQADQRGELRAGEKIELTPEQIERLRALGYAGG
jgi:arylsulfatase A-like enzyme